jgi:hypothetical protein
MQKKEAVMRSLLIFVLILIVAGCAAIPGGYSQMQLTTRDGGRVYYGTIGRELPLVTITVDIDRRIYSGTLERTGPNATYGLYSVYGMGDAATKSAPELSNTNYTKAILSTFDNRTLTCDFTDNRGQDVRGLCIDEARRVYDVVLS